jgi:hypothetical protein
MSTAVSRLCKNHSLTLPPTTPAGARAFCSERELPDPAVPTADAPLLVYLLSVLLFIATAGWIAHSLAQPTVLENAAVASFEREKHLPIVLSSTSLQEAEQFAVDVALRENEEQGLRLLSVPDPSEQLEPPINVAAKVAAVRPPKDKRATKVQSRYVRANWRDAWAYARYDNAFGSWWR